MRVSQFLIAQHTWPCGIWQRSCMRTRVQLRLLAQQKSTGKDLAKQVAKAKAQHEEMEAKVAAAALDSSVHKLRGAFVVFNEAWLADEAVASAPRGASASSLPQCTLLHKASLLCTHTKRCEVPLHRALLGACTSYCSALTDPSVQLTTQSADLDLVGNRDAACVARPRAAAGCWTGLPRDAAHYVQPVPVPCRARGRVLLFHVWVCLVTGGFVQAGCSGCLCRERTGSWGRTC